MKITVKRQFCNIALLSIVFVVSCKDTVPVVQKAISTDSLKNVTLDDNAVDAGVKILKTYPIKIDCTPNEQFANLYVCERIKNSDTIYVFDECTRPPDFAIDTSIHIQVNIDTRKILTNHPKKVTVFAPKEFRIPKNAKYVFAGLIGAIDG